MADTAAERRAIAALALALAALAGFALLAFPPFRAVDNLLDLLGSASINGILALGVLVVLVAGGLDIAFTAVASVVQFVLAVLLLRLDLGWAGALALATALGALMGAAHGAIVSALRCSPLIVTIALLNIEFGALILASGGEMRYDFPPFFAQAVLWRAGGWALSAQLAGLIAAALLTAALLRATHWGRLMRALGGSGDAARRLGLPLAAIRAVAYGWLGALAGLAGLLQAQLVQAVTPGSLVGRELDVIAATVLGGASLAGGRGTVTGTLLGVGLIALLGHLLVLGGVSSYWHAVASGLAVLGSLASQRLHWRRGGMPWLRSSV